MDPEIPGGGCLSGTADLNKETFSLCNERLDLVGVFVNLFSEQSIWLRCLSRESNKVPIDTLQVLYPTSPTSSVPNHHAPSLLNPFRRFNLPFSSLCEDLNFKHRRPDPSVRLHLHNFQPNHPHHPNLSNTPHPHPNNHDPTLAVRIQSPRIR